MKIKIILLFFLATINIFAQNELENLQIQLSKVVRQDSAWVNLNCKIANEYCKSEPEKGKVYALKALEISKKLNYINGIYEANRSFGNIGNAMTNGEFSLDYFINNQKYAITKYQQSQTFSDISIAYNNLQEFPKCLEFALKALKISEQLKNEQLTANNYTCLSKAYYQLKNFEKANYYTQESLKINLKINDETGLMRNYGNLAVFSILKNDEKKSIFYQLKCYELAKKLHDNVRAAISLSNIGISYMTLNEYDKSIKYTKEALPIAEKLNNRIMLCMLNGTIGGCYFERAILTDKVDFDLLKKSEFFFMKSLEISKKIGDKEGMHIGLLNLQNIALTRKDYKKAFENLQLANIYNDSLFNENTKETVQNLEDQRKIEIRDNKIKINNLKIESNKKQKRFLITGLFFLAVIGGLLFYQNHNKKKINEKLSLLNENLDESNKKLGFLNNELDASNKIKIRFLNILNHDLRSPVSSLIQYLKFKKSNFEILDLETKTRLENDNLSMAENLLAAMEDMLLWSKGQMEHFEPKIKNVIIESVFDETKKYFINQNSVKIVFENLENIALSTDENYLRTIVRNLTSNAIKAFDKKTKTENQTITWRAYKDNNQIFLSITDNGVGANPEQLSALYNDNTVVGIKTGLGLHLIRDLAKAINCSISVESKVNFGTVFILTIE